MTRVAFIDSGLGLVSFADAFLQLAPAAELLLAMDPDHMPYGALSPAQVRERVDVAIAAIQPWQPDAVVIACNTASVHALDHARAVLEPAVPVVGTVPAIKMAASVGEDFAVWATSATTHSEYQRGLIEQFAPDLNVTAVACPGLAQAIDRADVNSVDAAIAAAIENTPPAVESIVLGCTHYGLVADRIMAARPGTSALFDSPTPVARQTLRRLGLAVNTDAAAQAHGRVLATYLSGRRAALPETLAAYPAGRRLLARQS